MSNYLDDEQRKHRISVYKSDENVDYVVGNNVEKNNISFRSSCIQITEQII